MLGSKNKTILRNSLLARIVATLVWVHASVRFCQLFRIFVLTFSNFNLPLGSCDPEVISIFTSFLNWHFTSSSMMIQFWMFHVGLKKQNYFPDFFFARSVAKLVVRQCVLQFDFVSFSQYFVLTILYFSLAFESKSKNQQYFHKFLELTLTLAWWFNFGCFMLGSKNKTIFLNFSLQEA